MMIAEKIEAAYREGIEDGRDGWYNENDSILGLSDDELWGRSHAKWEADDAREREESGDA